MTAASRVSPALLASLLVCSSLVAADGPPKAPPSPDTFYNKTGFEGRQEVLTAAVVEAIRKAGPAQGQTLDFTPAQQQMLGVATAKAIKTISDDSPYQHEMNDALVKAHLTTLQFAKDNDMVPALVDHEVKTQMPMLVRVGGMIKAGGSPELGLIALTDRTACFYQLVQEYQRNGTTVRWKSPYGNVLAVTSRLGQHNFTEQEVFEIYTVPLMKKQAQLMGMEVDFAPWQSDGWITMTIRQPEAVAAR